MAFIVLESSVLGVSSLDVSVVVVGMINGMSTLGGSNDLLVSGNVVIVSIIVTE